MKVLVLDEKSRDRRRLLRGLAKQLKGEYDLSVELVFAEGVSHAQTMLEQSVGDDGEGYGAIIVRDAVDADFANVRTFLDCIGLVGFRGPVIGISALACRQEVMIEHGCTEVDSANHITALAMALTRPTAVLTPA